MSALDIACGANRLLGERHNFHLELHTATVRVLVEAGANVNRVDFAGYTPLLYAFYDGQAPIARLMVEHAARANPDINDKILATPRFNPQLVDLAIQAGASVDGVTVSGERPLHKALNGGNLRLTAELLKHGAKMNLPDGKGRTPANLARSILSLPRSGYNEWT